MFDLKKENKTNGNSLELKGKNKKLEIFFCFDILRY